jgi:Tol biopolymer transport system component
MSGVALGAVLAACVLPAAAGATVERHYEQVSPADKGDGDIIAEGLSTKAADSGDGVMFESRMVFGDAPGSGQVARTTYVARRGGGGWSTHSVTPMARPDALQVLAASTQMEVFSDDLSRAFVWAYDLPGVSDDQPLQQNLYAEDTVTGELRTVSKTQQDPINFFDFVTINFSGYSADGKHLAFVSPQTPLGFTRLLPEARADVPNVYKWDDGVLSVAARLPDGTVPQTGAAMEPNNINGGMSEDGSRLAFTASPDGVAPSQLYLHVDGRPSVWVSEPERSDTNDKTPANGIRFEGMTPDGNNVFFLSDDPLVDEDTTPGADMYRFTYSDDPESDDDNLTLITNNGASGFNGGTGGILVGMSDDATRVYIHQIDGVLKLWQEGVPGLTVVDPEPFRASHVVEWLTLLSGQPGLGRVSPDGNWLAYSRDISGGSGEYRMYLYDRSEQSLACVSCPSTASVVPSVTNSGARQLKGFRPRFLSDDGQVFFTSKGSLVTGDTNGVEDVYEYDGQTGTLSLLTTGRGSEPAMFADASRSGDDVFVVTRQQLVPSDRDDYVDLYDVRVGAGSPDQPVGTAPACEGDGCQGAPSGAPGDDVLGSLSLEDNPGSGPDRVRLAVRRRATFRGTAGLLSVRLARAGRISWGGRGLASGALVRGSRGTAKLRLRLAKRARAQLRRSGRYTTVVRLRFRAGDGRRASRSVRLTFRAAARNGGR